MTPLGLQLRFLRNEKGLSQQALADRLGLAPKMLSAIETGRKSPPGGTWLLDIQKALGLTQQQYETLMEAVSCSSYRLQAPRDASPQELRVAHWLVDLMGGCLQPQEISQIEQVVSAARDRARSVECARRTSS